MSAAPVTVNLSYIVAAFFVTGDPKGQPRPRAFARGGHAAVYDPGTAEGWKGQVALGSRSHAPTAPIEGPTELTLEFRFRRPKALCRRRDPDGPIAHTGKPDLDNLAKAVLDAMTSLGWWRDDSQVCALSCTKRYTHKVGELPGVFVRVARPEVTPNDDHP